METVLNRLAGTRINAQMMEQEDLTKAFMALLHHIVDGCNNRGIGLEAVSFSAPEVSGNSIKAKVVFGHGGRTTVSAGNISGDISKFFLQKNLAWFCKLPHSIWRRLIKYLKSIILVM